MFERILLPLDGSALGEAILPQIARILRREDSEILLLHVAQMQTAAAGTGFAAPASENPAGAARAYLDRLCRRFSSEGARVRALVEVGSPAPMILDTAERENATLIAMATHGRTGLARWVFGSVSEKVLRASPVPLLLVRSFQEGGSPAPSEALTFERILVPIAQFHLRILGYVRELAILFGSRVTLLHVVEPDEDVSTRDRARAELRAVQGDLEAAGIPTESRERQGDPALEILECAREEESGIIAMTTHARSGPSRWAVGSVTEKVLKSALVPMLVVRTR